MPVYMARFGALGPVKIGHSLFVQRRLESIQARLWDDLMLIRLLDGDEADERALHKRFSHLRIKYEWFHYSNDMMGDVGLADLTNTPERALPVFDHPRGAPDQLLRATALREWMVRNNLFEQDLINALGCSRKSIEEWLRSGHRPRKSMVLRLIALSNGELEASFAPAPSYWSEARRLQAAA